MLKTCNWQRLENLLSAWVYWLCIPVSTKANEFPPWYIPDMLDSMVGDGAQGQQNINNTYGIFKQKKKQNLSKSDSENEAADFSRFIVIESWRRSA